jgi:hypothetical protein
MGIDGRQWLADLTILMSKVQPAIVGLSTMLSFKTEQLYHLGYNDVLSVENRRTFRWNMSPSSAGVNNRASKKPA